MKIILSNTASEPIYAQIVEQIKRQILGGELKAGDALPSIRQLAKDLHISVITTKRAYEELERAGFIHAMTGRGSFVADQSPELLREQRLNLIEEKLADALREASALGLSLEEVQQMIILLYEEQ